MKAFTIHQKMHNMLTNEVMVQYSFQGKEEEKKLDQVFKDPESANAYLETHMRDWLLNCLEDYIMHKRHIIEGGRHLGQEKALKVCMAAYADFHEKRCGLRLICERFTKGYEWFAGILPVQNNPSFENSCLNLAEIKKFCENYLNQHKNNQL